ncbi:MAG: hypothetical protein CL431_01800 [Acidimicrobiaceae bacterium]|nr:hypothetical protein [Acidimicrobiaceae bacterium]|tara:strand:+ start:133565 stop:135316 length:1752 start_codon:yes stop_codon:yes gene_type:complete
MNDTRQRLKLVVRVIPDIDGVAHEFDYAVPDSWNLSGESNYLQVGTIVRFKFKNRIVRGWVIEINPPDKFSEELIPLKKISGIGPNKDVVDLAKWASNNWYGPVSKFLRIASPKLMIRARHNFDAKKSNEPEIQDHAKIDLSDSKVIGREIPPLGDRWPLIQETIAHGNSLILVPSVKQAQLLVGRLKSIGVRSGLYGKDWLLGVQGATIVGTRSAAFASIKDLAAILMIDEHDDAYRNESAPTWNARDVVLRRAKEGGIPLVFTSPILTPEVRKELKLIRTGHDDLQSGWGNIRILDPRKSDESKPGLWPSEVIDQLKNSDRSIVILNRKGRSKLLVCSSCDEVVVCAECMANMSQPNDEYLICSQNHRRPVVCSYCLSTKLKNLRIGITRAKDELQALLQQAVQEIHSDTNDLNLHKNKYLLGTNAALHRVDWADVIFFADYDQELYASGYRSEEIALSNLIRAVRITNARPKSSGQVILQTRSQKNQLIEVIKSGDFDRWNSINSNRRKLLSLPPYGSIAEVSGPGAKDYVELINLDDRIEVLGPLEGSWLIKSKSHGYLLKTVAGVPRPKARIRIAVNA